MSGAEKYIWFCDYYDAVQLSKFKHIPIYLPYSEEEIKELANKWNKDLFRGGSAQIKNLWRGPEYVELKEPFMTLDLVTSIPGETQWWQKVRKWWQL